jgi:site-specific DNA recombinase
VARDRWLVRYRPYILDREQLISCSFFIISKLYKYFHVKTILLFLDLTIMKTYNPCRVYTNGKDFIMAETKSVDYFLDQIGLTFLGVPGGTFAFAYARVSSDEQATEGKTGVPRQLTHIHEKASTEGYYIPREFIYVDDASGFEFQDRPELSKLRRAYMDPERPANAVVIEALDRLSRNADWHQGFLLDEMKQFGIRTVFWKVYSSRIERAVMGAISQDGMEDSLRRMHEGQILKAKSGRVTARKPAYGYKIVDSDGKEGHKARKDSHYAIDEDTAPFVIRMFEMYASGSSIGEVTDWLEENAPLPNKRTLHWYKGTVHRMLKNTVYIGQYVHGKDKRVKGPSKRAAGLLHDSKPVLRKIQRPRDEWIIVDVPPMIDRATWEMCQRRLEINKAASRRNAKDQYLLSGICKCAYCDSSFTKSRERGHRKDGRTVMRTKYRCSSSFRKYVGRCGNSQVEGHILEDAVWDAVCGLLLHPESVLDSLDNILNDERNASILAQIAYIEREIEKNAISDDRLWKAYDAGAFDEDEYAEKRAALKARLEDLKDDHKDLRSKVLTEEDIEAHRQQLLDLSQQAQESGLSEDADYEVRRQTILTVVDKIIVDAKHRTFTLEGVLGGTFTFSDRGGLGEGDGGNKGPGGEVRRYEANFPLFESPSVSITQSPLPVMLE